MAEPGKERRTSDELNAIFEGRVVAERRNLAAATTADALSEISENINEIMAAAETQRTDLGDRNTDALLKACNDLLDQLERKRSTLSGTPPPPETPAPPEAEMSFDNLKDYEDEMRGRIQLLREGMAEFLEVGAAKPSNAEWIGLSSEFTIIKNTRKMMLDEAILDGAPPADVARIKGFDGMLKIVGGRLERIKPDVVATKSGEAKTLADLTSDESLHPAEAKKLRVLAASFQAKLDSNPDYNPVTDIDPITHQNAIETLKMAGEDFDEAVLNLDHGIYRTATEKVAMTKYLRRTYLQGTAGATDSVDAVLTKLRERRSEQEIKAAESISAIENLLKLTKPSVADVNRAATGLDLVNTTIAAAETEIAKLGPDAKTFYTKKLDEAKKMQTEVENDLYKLVTDEFFSSPTAAELVTELGRTPAPTEKISHGLKIEQLKRTLKIDSIWDSVKRFFKPGVVFPRPDQVTAFNERLKAAKFTSETAEHKSKSALEEQLNDKDLFTIIKDMETSGDLGRQDTQFTFENVIKRKSFEMAAKIADEKQAAAFIELINSCIVPLYEFGVLTPASLSGFNLTVKNADTFLTALAKNSAGSNAIDFNIRMNKNDLVNSGEVDNEQFRPGMGVVQQLVCAAYMLMREKYLPWSPDPKHPELNPHARVDSYKQGQSQELFDILASRNGLVVKDEQGNKHTLNLKDEMDKFPPEVQEIIKYMALLKTSRDDLGNKASNYMMGYLGKSPKIGDTGSGSEDAGSIARAVYKSAQTDNRQEYMVMWSYVDPMDLDLLKLDPTIVDKHKDPNFLRREVIHEKMEEIENYYHYLCPAWEDEVLPTFQFKPDRWDDDFPGLDDLANRTEYTPSPSDYKMSRDAFRKLKELAYSSPTFDTHRELEAIEKTVSTKMGEMTGEIGKLFAYVGKPNSSGRTKKGTAPSAEFTEKRYTRFHGLTKAAVGFFIANLVLSVPPVVISQAEDRWNRVFSLGNTKINAETMMYHNKMVDSIEKFVKGYGTISGEYADLINEVASLDGLVPVYIRPQRRINEFVNRRIANSPSLSALESDQLEDLYREFPTMPFIPKKDTTPDAH